MGGEWAYRDSYNASSGRNAPGLAAVKDYPSPIVTLSDESRPHIGGFTNLVTFKSINLITDANHNYNYMSPGAPKLVAQNTNFA